MIIHVRDPLFSGRAMTPLLQAITKLRRGILEGPADLLDS